MYNHVVLVGRLGKDVESRYTPGGMAVANFSLAATTGFGETKKTYWANVTCFGKTAEACATFVSKGSLVLVEGHIEEQSWEKDGERKFKTVIIANRVQFLNKTSGGSDEEYGADTRGGATDLEPF